MKKNILIIALSLISFSGFSQTSKNHDIKINGKDTIREMDFPMNEIQMYKLYQLLSAAKVGMSESQQISAFDVTHTYFPFADSIMNAMSIQSEKWHPKPVPKTDSANKKNP